MNDLMLFAMNIDWAAVAIQQLPVVIAVLLGAFAKTLCRWTWGACRWIGIAARGLPRKAVRRCASVVRRVGDFVFRREAKPKPESGYAARRRQMAEHRPLSFTAKDAAKAMQEFSRAIGDVARPDAPAFISPEEHDAIISAGKTGSGAPFNEAIHEVVRALKVNGYTVMKTAHNYDHNRGEFSLNMRIADVQMGK